MLGVCNNYNPFPAFHSPEKVKALKIIGIFLIIGSLSAASLLLPNVGYTPTLGLVGCIGVILLTCTKLEKKPTLELPQQKNDLCKWCTKFPNQFPEIQSIEQNCLEVVFTFLSSYDIISLSGVSQKFHKYFHPKVPSEFLLNIKQIEQNNRNRPDLDKILLNLPLDSTTRKAFLHPCSAFQKSWFIIKNIKKTLLILNNKDPRFVDKNAKLAALRNIEITLLIERCDYIQQIDSPHNNFNKLLNDLKEAINKCNLTETLKITKYAASTQNAVLIKLLFNINDCKLSYGYQLLGIFASEKKIELLTEKEIQFLLSLFQIDNIAVGGNLLDFAVRNGNIAMLSCFLPIINYDQKDQLKFVLIRMAFRYANIKSASFFFNNLIDSLTEDQIHALIQQALDSKNRELINFCTNFKR